MLDTRAWCAIEAEFLINKTLSKHPEWSQEYPRKLEIYYLKTIGEDGRYFTLSERVARAEYKVWRDMWGQDRPESECPATNPSVQDHVLKSIERDAFEHSQSEQPNRPILEARRRSTRRTSSLLASTQSVPDMSLATPKDALPDTWASESEERMKDLKAIREELNKNTQKFME